jgi:hypothetical protein
VPAFHVVINEDRANEAAHAVVQAVLARMMEGDDDEGEEGDQGEEGEDEYEDHDVRLDRMDSELRAARAEIERLTDRDELQRHEVEVLRNHVRRANAERASTRAAEISRHDAMFFDGVRRRFVESWREDLELMMKMQPHQLLFFGHLLNLPVISATDDNNNARRLEHSLPFKNLRIAFYLRTRQVRVLVLLFRQLHTTRSTWSTGSGCRSAPRLGYSGDDAKKALAQKVLRKVPLDP